MRGSFVSLCHKTQSPYALCRYVAVDKAVEHPCTSRLKNLCLQGQLDKVVEILSSLDRQCLQAPIDIASFVLKECTKREDSSTGTKLYQIVLKDGQNLDPYLGVLFIRMFAVCGNLPKANLVFEKLPETNLFAWSTIISAHAKHGDCVKAIHLFCQMLQAGIQLDGHIYVAVFQACANAATLVHGKILYGLVIEENCEAPAFIRNAVINMFAKCQSLEDAHFLFVKCKEPDIILWNVIIECYVQNGCGDRALQCFKQMRLEGADPSLVTYISILKSCSNMTTLQEGKLIHMYIIQNELESDAFAGSILIDMYAKCGSLKSACDVFSKTKDRDAVIWRALITGYACHGYDMECFELFCQMQQEGIEIGRNTFASVLKACCNMTALTYAKQIHVKARESGFKTDNHIGSSLIDMYIKFRNLENAHRVFDELHNRDLLVWTSLMGGYMWHGYYWEALDLFKQMHREGVKPDHITFNIVLKGCVKIWAPEQGKMIHGFVLESACDSALCVQSALIDMYLKFGELEDAERVFRTLLYQRAMTWSPLVTQNLEERNLIADCFQQQQAEYLSSSKVSGDLLQICSSMMNLKDGMLIHSCICQSGLESISEALLIDMYAKCGSLSDACRVFDSSNQDSGIWGIMLASYAYHGLSAAIFQGFQQMQLMGTQPNQVAYVNAIKSCIDEGNLSRGALIHATIVATSFEHDVLVNNSLIDMYAKCGSLKAAETVFDGLIGRDVVTCNALIAGYSRSGCIKKAFKLFSKMQNEGPEVDHVTYIEILKCCSNDGLLHIAKLIHYFIKEQGLENVLVENTLIDMYTSCESLENAVSIFDKLRCRNHDTWSRIIAAHTQHGHVSKALHYFEQMLGVGMQPDDMTLTCVLKACSSIAAVEKGRLLHCQVLFSGSETNVFVGNTLIDMYSKCGKLGDAQRVFHMLPWRDIVTWNAIIGGCAHNNASELALTYFNDMQNGEVKPNAMTFLCVLSACSHMGLAADSIKHFKYMAEDLEFTPELAHYNALIDLLGRTGQLTKAEDLLYSSPYGFNCIGLMSLLGHCKVHGSFDLGSECFEHIIRADNRNAAGYALMSGMYSYAGSLQKANNMERLRIDANAWKRPGGACIEVDNLIHDFTVGCDNHPQSGNIYGKLIRLNVWIRGNGYLPGF